MGQVQNSELRFLPQGLIHSPGGEGTPNGEKGLQTVGWSFQHLEFPVLDFSKEKRPGGFTKVLVSLCFPLPSSPLSLSPPTPIFSLLPSLSVSLFPFPFAPLFSPKKGSLDPSL